MTLGRSTTMWLAKSGCCPAASTSPAHSKPLGNMFTICSAQAYTVVMSMTCSAFLSLQSTHNRKQNTTTQISSGKDESTSWKHRLTAAMDHQHSWGHKVTHPHLSSWPGHLMSSTLFQSRPPWQPLGPCKNDKSFLSSVWTKLLAFGYRNMTMYSTHSTGVQHRLASG